MPSEIATPQPTSKKLPRVPAHFRKDYKRMLHAVGKFIADYELIVPGDRIMVAVSGGKDSLSLLYILLDLRAKAPVPFSVFAYTLDQKQPGFDAAKLVAFYEELGVEYHIGERDTYSIVKEKIPEGQTYCSLCSRLRRGILYDEAVRLNASKIALGHHANDAVETLLLNLFHNGRLASMPPLLKSDDGRNTVIRPLLALGEAELAAFAQAMAFPVLPCNLCGSQENLERRRIKEWLAKEEERFPHLLRSASAALANVKPSHLWDRHLL